MISRAPSIELMNTREVAIKSTKNSKGHVAWSNFSGNLHTMEQILHKTKMFWCCLKCGGWKVVNVVYILLHCCHEVRDEYNQKCDEICWQKPYISSCYCSLITSALLEIASQVEKISYNRIPKELVRNIDQAYSLLCTWSFTVAMFIFTHLNGIYNNLIQS